MSKETNAVATVALGAIGVVLLVSLLMGLPLMLLWNWLVPAIFGGPTIGFWQAIGLNLLASILFNKTQSVSSS